ncbi:MAG: hypothetical protein GQ570_11855 [Helicobacteraceae bacterium]|nr:hypothetical protein [Helicobacteraceae bacterium]
MRLETLNSTFQETKIIGATGEYLASETIKIYNDISKILIEYQTVMNSETKTSQFIEMASAEDLQYAATVAMILGEAKAKIDSLG